jgi:hypothetical protein
MDARLFLAVSRDCRPPRRLHQRVSRIILTPAAWHVLCGAWARLRQVGGFFTRLSGYGSSSKISELFVILIHLAFSHSNLY